MQQSQKLEKARLRKRNADLALQQFQEQEKQRILEFEKKIRQLELERN